jgi:CheY-like chemotaxis protein
MTPRRVLVVDENLDDAADSLAMLLKLNGHEVHTVYAATEALKAAAHSKRDMTFVDIGLPVMDGYKVAQQLRSSNAHVPIALDRPHRLWARGRPTAVEGCGLQRSLGQAGNA